MDDGRRIAFNVLMDVEEKKAYSNLALNHHCAGAKPEARALARRLSYGVLENKLYLDYIISHYLDEPNRDPGPIEKNILRLGLYQIIFMDTIPDYASVSETVNLSKRYKKGIDGFVNAVLRGYLRSGEEIKLPDREEDESLYLSVKYSYSKWMIDMWIEEYGLPFTEELLAAGNKVPSLCIRPNMMKITRKELKKSLENKGYLVEEGRLSSLALKIREGTSDDILTRTALYRDGFFSIQDESSMISVEIMDPNPEEVIADVCAAPGGKTMYIAEKMRDKGQIIALDIHSKKLALIKEQAERLGIHIVETEVWDSETVNSKMIEKADRVLVDAPCSGLGTVRRKPEVKYREKSVIEGLPAIQKKILSASSNYVKPGGILLYCTCTINRKENQEVTKDFLMFNKEFSKVEEIQLLPNINDTDGFYICKMQRR